VTNQLLAEAGALPDLNEYDGMSAVDIAHAIINWPEGSEDQARAIAALRQRAPGIGHNQPPLAEAIAEELEPRRARAGQLLAAASGSVIVDEVSAAKVVDLTRQLKDLHDEGDKARLARTKPYREAVSLINHSYDAEKLRLGVAIDGLNVMLTTWDDKQRVAVEAERRRLAEEAARREEEATAARAAAEAKTQAGRTDPAAALEALKATDEAERLTRRAEAIRHEPTRSQLGQTTRRKQIKFVVEDLAARLRDIMGSPRKKQIKAAVDLITDQELRSLGVAAVEHGVEMAGVRMWVEEGGVNVRR
jgi:hypothetical protein